LCLLVRGEPPEEILLGFKKAGFGAGKYNGFGGKVEPGETIAGAAVREVGEEVGLRVSEGDLEPAGRLTFLFPANPEWDKVGHVFVVRRWEGEPVESAEMRPTWFRVEEIPFGQMWQGDVHWLPRVLAGERGRGWFRFGEDNETVTAWKVEAWDVDHIRCEGGPMDTMTEWRQWIPPYDPRPVDGASVTEDEHGRLIETADCSQRCPGCGICCAGYRDVMAADYAGVEEFEGNLEPGRGGLVELESGLWYRACTCGETCPGYGCCCHPFEQRQRPQTVADARRILLEDDASQRWQMQEALLILAHEGAAEAVDALEAFVPHAHTRLAGFAECALDEGRYFATVPRNAEEERTMMKREVLAAWEARAIRAQSKMDEELEPEIERLHYQAEIAQRLLARAQDESARETWQTQVDVLQMMADMTENDVAEEREEVALCEAMIDEIQADLAADQPE